MADNNKLVEMSNLGATLRGQEAARNRVQVKRARQQAALDASNAELIMWDEAIERSKTAIQTLQKK